MRIKRLGAGISGLLLLGFVGVNVLAWNHAWAFTHYVEDGERTPNPEDLTPLQKAKVLLFGVRIPKQAPGRTAPDELAHSLPANYRPTHSGPLATSQTTDEELPVGTIFLFHGYAANRHQVDTTASMLGKRGWDTIQVDFHGHGDSPGNTTSLGWHEAQDVVDVVGDQEGAVVLYGFSMGAAAVLRAAGPLGLEVDAIIAEACFGRFDTTVRQRFDNLGLPSWPGTELLLFWGSRQVGFDAYAHNPQDYIAQVQAPVLVLHGGQDTRVTDAEAQALGAYGELVVTPELGHQQLAEVDPAAFHAVVDPFLNAHLGY